MMQNQIMQSIMNAFKPQHQQVMTPQLGDNTPQGVVDQNSLAQQQQLVNLLRQQSLTGPPQQTGNVVVRNSPLAYLPQIMSGFMANRKQDSLNQGYQAFAQQQETKRQQALQGVSSFGQQTDQPAQPPQQIPPQASQAPAVAGQSPDQQAMPPQGIQADQPPPPAPEKWKPAAQVDYAKLAATADNAVRTGAMTQEQAKEWEAGIKSQHDQQKLTLSKDGTMVDERSGKHYDIEGNLLNQAAYDKLTGGSDDNKPYDELSKLNADYKAGRMSQSDYNARKVLMTTRAPQAYPALTAADPGLEAAAQRIANYEVPAPTGRQAYTPGGIALMNRVDEIHKGNGTNYSAAQFPAYQKAYRDFSSGKQGDQVRSFNVGISHLNTASELADALNNGDIRAVNSIGNMFAEQTGSAAPTNLDTAKEVIKGEIVKAVSGAGGGVADRERALSGIDKASSPAQLKGAIQTAQKLMGGQLGGLKRQYEQSTGRHDFERLLSPDSTPYLNTKEATGDKNFGNANAGNAAHPTDIQSLLDKYK